MFDQIAKIKKLHDLTVLIFKYASLMNKKNIF